jgi:hypothetical protein
VHLAEDQRRECDMDDEGIECRVRIVRNATESAQRDADRQAQDEQDDIVHPVVPLLWFVIASLLRSSFFVCVSNCFWTPDLRFAQ